MIVEKNIGVKGSYSIKIVRDNKEDIYKFDNLLLDNFFNRLSSTLDSISGLGVLKVGTGTTPPIATQTAIESPLIPIDNSWPISSAVYSNGELVDGDSKIKCSATWNFDFGLGNLIGNISEVGFILDSSQSTGDNTVHSRTLVKDSQGQPTTITVTAQDQLYIEYKIELLMDVADSVYNLFLDNDGLQQQVEITSAWRSTSGSISLYTSLLMPQCYFAYGGSFNSTGVSPSGWEQREALYLINHKSYEYNVDGGRLVKYSIPTDKGNLTGGIQYIWGWGGGNEYVKYKFDPPIPKTADDTFEFSVLQKFNRVT